MDHKENKKFRSVERIKTLSAMGNLISYVGQTIYNMSVIRQPRLSLLMETVIPAPKNVKQRKNLEASGITIITPSLNNQLVPIMLIPVSLKNFYLLFKFLFLLM